MLQTTMVNNVLRSVSVLSPKPVTPLESSRNFFPESYIMDSQIPTSFLVVISASESLSSVDSKINSYALLYLDSFRHWHWLTISIRIPCSSKYWAITKTTAANNSRKWRTPNIASCSVLPYSLLKKIQVFLNREERFEDDTTICLSLSDGDGVMAQPQKPHTKAPPASFPLSSAFSNALDYLHDLGCRQYDESDVVQLQIVDPPNRFCSSLNGTLVYEIMLPGSVPTVDLLYAIRVLHCMNGDPGFVKLIGIVTNDSRNRLKSYLIEYPNVSSNIIKMAADPSIPWERRERWAYQTIKAISQLHAQGFVIGGLTLFSWPVIDNSDSIKFWYFRERFTPGRKGGAYYPPEFRHVRNMSPTICEADCPHVTSKTDIFHLGLLLWLLAENKPATHESPVCRRSVCHTSHDTDTNWDLSHAEPVALPLLPESIPNYFREILDACRRENPSERPSASNILERFPFSNNFQQVQSELPEPNNGDMKMMVEGMRIAGVTCDNCAKIKIPLPTFHCNVCNLADFDLCQTCYDSGSHCNNDSHLLVKMGNVGSWIVPKRYHSSIKSSGVRDIIDL